MPAPTDYPDWDTNATHTTALVAGHKTDGFAEDEVPASDELNEWMMLVGLWIRFLGAFAGDLLTSANEWTQTQTFDEGPIAPDYYTNQAHDLIIPAGMAFSEDPSGATGPYKTYSSGVLIYWTFLNDTKKLLYPIPLKVGDKIGDYSARVQKTSNGTQSITMHLYKVVDGTVSDADADNGDITNSANNPGWLTLTTSLAPDVPVADGTTKYYLIIHTSGGFDAEDHSSFVKISILRPPP